MIAGIEDRANQFAGETKSAKRSPALPRNFRVAFRTFVKI
jgi:hypothetical protein